VGTLKEVKEATGGGSIAASYTFDDLIYCSREMEELVRNAKNISFKDTTTLIQSRPLPWPHDSQSTVEKHYRPDWRSLTPWAAPQNGFLPPLSQF
jgi:hypothetical protein